MSFWNYLNSMPFNKHTEVTKVLQKVHGKIDLIYDLSFWWKKIEICSFCIVCTSHEFIEDPGIST